MSEFINVKVNKLDLLKAIRYECETFFAFYIGDKLTLEVPDLHIDVWDDLLHYVEQINQGGVTKSLRKLFAIPREHAKSTIAKLAVILLLKFTPFQFVLYASKTNGHAKNAIRDILFWLNSENEKSLFGPMITEKSSETESLWITKIVIRDIHTGEPRWKRCIFKALGARQQIRGLLIDSLRPQIVVVDDIEDRDNTTVELQPQLDEWFMGSFLKSFASFHFVLFIGNMIRETTLLARLSKESSWNPTVFGSLVLDKNTSEIRALWVGKNTVEGLLEEYRENRRIGTGHVWEAEMMNLTQDAILGESLGDIVRPVVPDPEDVTEGFLCLDPALTDEKTGEQRDESAITVHVRITGFNIPVIIDSVTARVGETELCRMMLDMSFRWGISTWVIESVAAQKLFIPLFKLLLKEEGINSDRFLMLPITGGKANKPSRIVAFRNTVKQHSYAIAESQDTLVDRLRGYSPVTAKHDDLEDSAALGSLAWATYGDVITVNGITRMPHQVWLAGVATEGGVLDGMAVAPY